MGDGGFGFGFDNGCGCGCGCGGFDGGRCRDRDRDRCDDGPTVTTVTLADANTTLKRRQVCGGKILDFQSSPLLSAARTVTIPEGNYTFVAKGDPTKLGSFPLTFTTGAGTTVNVSAGQTVILVVSDTGVVAG